MYMTKGRLALIKQRGYSDEPLKQFDGVLYTPVGTFSIEFKYGYNKLAPHQKNNQDRINAINQSFFVIREKKGRYLLQYNDETVLDTDNLGDVIDGLTRRKCTER